jgi:hypothetical protein
MHDLSMPMLLLQEVTSILVADGVSVEKILKNF